MTPLNWAVLIVGLGAAVLVWWVSRRKQDDAGDAAKSRSSPQLDMFSSAGEFDEFGVGRPRRVSPSVDGTASSPAQPEAPQKIIALLIASRDGTPMQGMEIHAALRAHGLVFGARQIYHRMVEDEPVYSVASLLKPGIIDPAEEKAFGTPGLSIFMVLPGPMQPVSAFKEMLATARSLSVALHANLYDMRRQPLGMESITRLEREVEQWARSSVAR